MIGTQVLSLGSPMCKKGSQPCPQPHVSEGRQDPLPAETGYIQKEEYMV